jgi:hypothetical protein
MTLRYLGPNNGYMPQSTGQLIAFIRQPNKFKINNYVQYVGHDEPTGVYGVLGRDESVRVVTDSEFRWEDGADMPTGELYKSRFEVQEFRAIRRAYPWSVGNVTEKTSKFFKPSVVQMAEGVSMAMTNRTKQVITMLETASNWGQNTGSANVLNGGKGFWDKASDLPDSPQYNAIAETFLAVAQKINLYTNSVVEITDIRCVISPGAARRMSQAPEIKHYLANSVYAKKAQENPGENINMLWGLPKTYMGIEIVVEDATIVTERPNPAASSTSAQAANPGNRNYVKSDTSAVFCSRPGGLDGQYGSNSFSTVQVYYYGGEASKETRKVPDSDGNVSGGLLAVKAAYDSWNEKVKGAVVEYWVPKLAAAPAGYLVTGLFSS